MPNKKARQLRQTSTDAERRMWSALRDRRLLRYKFRRQHPVGDFIVDFACTEYQLVIEVDGGQHGEQEQGLTHRSITYLMEKTGVAKRLQRRLP